MKFPSKEIVEKIRKEYPVGSRVELTRMEDEQAPPLGTKGIVEGVDDTASIMVLWDNGSHLHVVYGEDQCRIIKETLEEFLREHPLAEIHIMSPNGYVAVDSERTMQLLNGQSMKGHPGDMESWVDIPAKDILNQVICNCRFHNGIYAILTDYLEKRE